MGVEGQGKERGKKRGGEKSVKGGGMGRETACTSGVFESHHLRDVGIYACDTVRTIGILVVAPVRKASDGYARVTPARKKCPLRSNDMPAKLTKIYPLKLCAWTPAESRRHFVRSQDAV